MGQVTGGPEADPDNVGLPNRVHGGQRWDFVVPVEMEGHPGLTLAFNRDENPYDVADLCGPLSPLSVLACLRNSLLEAS